MEGAEFWDGQKGSQRNIYPVEYFKDWYRFVRERGKTKAGRPAV